MTESKAKQISSIWEVDLKNKFILIFIAVSWGIATPFLGSLIYAINGMHVYEFTEELAKFGACYYGTPFAILSTGVFAVGEMIHFLNQFKDTIDFNSLVKIRLICVAFHFFLLSIQLFGYKVASMQESPFKKYSAYLMGFSIAWMSHWLWNEHFGYWLVTKMFI